MRQLTVTLLVFFTILLVHRPPAAAVTMPRSVVGTGGGASVSSGLRTLCTLGQAVIGVVRDTTHMNEIGFWYHHERAVAGVKEGWEHTLATGYWLGPSRPNPFGGTATVHFAVPERSQVRLCLYDVTGREVSTLLETTVEPGFHRVVVEGKGLSSGVYFCQMVAGSYVETRRAVVLK